MSFLAKHGFTAVWTLSLLLVSFLSTMAGYGALYVFGILYPLAQSILIGIRYRSWWACLWLLHIIVYFAGGELDWMTEKEFWFGIPILIVLNMFFGQVLLRIIAKSWDKLRWFFMSCIGGLSIFIITFPMVHFNFRIYKEWFDTSLIFLIWIIGFWMMGKGLRKK